MTSSDKSPKPVDESEFLAEQAERAKMAAFAALNNAKVALEQNLDPRPAVRDHPLIAIGSAAAVGFLAILMAVPSKEEQELRRMERMQRVLHPETAVASSGNGKANGQAPPPPHGVWASIIHEIVQLIRPILLTAITSGIKSATNPTKSPSSDTNQSQSL